MDYKIIKKIIFDSIKIDSYKLPEVDVLTIAHDNDRSFFYNGKYYSPLVDTIEDDLKINGVKIISISRIISTIKGDLSYGKVYSPEGDFARALISKRVKGFFKKNDYPYSNYEERIWGKILDLTKAKKVIGILPSRELCNACHKRNIWVADVQHGVIAKNHPWYGVKFRGNDKKEFLPNAFLVWDQGSANVINEWAINKGIETKLIGNRWIAKFLATKSDKLVEGEKLQASKYFNRNSLKNILISLSWGETGIENGIIPQDVIELIKLKHTKYNFYLRLHPNQIKGFATHESALFFKIYKNELDGICEWEFPTKGSLPSILSFIDMHISWSSSVAIEAAQMGIKSALLDPRLLQEFSGDYYEYYNKNGYIEFINCNLTSISNWVEKNASNVKSPEEYNSYNDNYNEIINFLSN